MNFNQIPSGLLIPFVAVEFDTSAAQQGPALLTYNGLLIGQKLSGGTWAQDSIQSVSNLDQVIAGAGRGSMLHRQYLGWRAANKSTPLYMGVLADNGAGVAAQGTIVVGGPATAAGTIQLYIGGVLVPVGVNSGDASTAIATAIGAAINANADLPVTATVSTSTVTLTFRHKGTVGNTLDVRANYLKTDVLPAGVTITVTAMGVTTAGTTNPTLTNLIAAMASLWFQIWTHPYTDTTTLGAIETELARRSGPMVQQQALAVTAASGTYSTLTTLGLGRNSPNSSIWSQTGKNPLTPPMEFAAEVAATVALAGQADPGRPLQTLALSWTLPTLETDVWDPLSEQNGLLGSGISTTVRAAGGVVQLQRGVTTYQTSPSGAPDTSYRDIPTLLTLMYLRFSFRTRIQQKFPRHKLGDDGVRFGPGQFVITPKLGKAEAVAWFQDMMDLVLVENPDQFKRDLVCVRDTVNRKQLNWLLPPELISQFIVGAAQVQFR